MGIPAQFPDSCDESQIFVWTRVAAGDYFIVTPTERFGPLRVVGAHPVHVDLAPLADGRKVSVEGDALGGAAVAILSCPGVTEVVPFLTERLEISVPSGCSIAACGTKAGCTVDDKAGCKRDPQLACPEGVPI